MLEDTNSLDRALLNYEPERIPLKPNQKNKTSCNIKVDRKQERMLAIKPAMSKWQEKK